MTPRAARVISIVLLALLALAPAAAGQRDVRQRHVYVSVTTNDQVPIAGLTAADFTVREDTVAREVLAVGPAPPPTHVGLLVDDSAAAQPLVSDLRAAFGAFVRGIVGVSPEPMFALTTFGERPTQVVPYSIDPALVLGAIGRLFARPGGGAYFLDAVLESTATLRKLKAERPVLVAFIAEDGPEFGTPTNARVREALQESGASLWTVVLQARDPDLTRSEARERASVATDVARASGGDSRMVLSRPAIQTTLTKLAVQIRSRYDVTYGRPESLVPPSRLQVQVKRSGARVAAPAWTGR